jgi:hypothetical protein
MPIPTQAEYEQREAELLAQKLRVLSEAPKNDRHERANAWLEAMRKDPKIVAQRVGWLIDGNYGYGSYMRVQDIWRAPRADKISALRNLVGALEWLCPLSTAMTMYEKLTKKERETLNYFISKALAMPDEGEEV